jgi:L-threonylcarbamoyladenylate synthase
MSASHASTSPLRTTRILAIDSIKPPTVDAETDLGTWFQEIGQYSPQAENLVTAASAICQSATPVAFPTETVYGLGADATRSDAVKGIYRAKQRPSDNPLIVHVGSLPKLRKLLRPPEQGGELRNGYHSNHECIVSKQQISTDDPIPPIYHPLIQRFWPGPLTILLPLPQPSPLAPEVNSGLSTFGVRMPSSPLARLLISLTDRPLAAPSANASTRPSPTTAQHVYDDLNGRIDIILDGGPCSVGVESTVVDGLSDPPAILRPGGIGIEEIRALGGPWKNVTIGYQDRKQDGNVNGEGPRAPGMKYRHYAPKGQVFLFEAGVQEKVVRERVEHELADKGDLKVGIVRTRRWPVFLNFPVMKVARVSDQASQGWWVPTVLNRVNGEKRAQSEIWCISLGSDVQSIAQGLFSALRTLDEAGCQVILIEGISDTEGDLAAAIMNRLRKAAEVDVK